MVSKVELERKIQRLQNQMVDLENRCKEREDKVVHILEAIGPFIPTLSEACKRDLENKLQQDGLLKVGEKK